MRPKQLPLFSPGSVRMFNYPFPSTRYQGSKRSLVNWIWETVYQLPFNSVLDVFGGTGAVSHMFKNAGKQVTYNDSLAFNWNIGLALIENQAETLSDDEVEVLLEADPNTQYPQFIQDTFKDIYFTDSENAWLDRVIFNIDHLIKSPCKQAIARFGLFQACLIKRPYNLFHRANLYMRTAAVTRSFGNKTTWDTAFEKHFRHFVREANQAVFDNGLPNRALQKDALETPIGAELVYIDPPYLNKKGTGVNYRDFYHFLEGITSYSNWGTLIEYSSKHRRLEPIYSPWNDADAILGVFEQLIQRHQKSILVVSYRDDGVPSKSQLLDLLRQYKGRVDESVLPKQYALSRQKSHEVLLVAY